jgi:hypothetical protein
MHIHLTPCRHLAPRGNASSGASSPGANTFDTLEIKVMNTRQYRRSLSVYLAAAALLAASAAHASDHRLWREQIAAAPLAVLTLAPAAARAPTPAAEWLWRDQVPAPHALPVYVARSTGEGETSADALWREQHRPAEAAQKPIRIVTEQRRR